MSENRLWNEEEILMEFNGDEDILIDTCEMFLDLYKGHLEKLWNAHTNKDFLSASEEAHSIKGMVGYFNKGLVLDAAREIESKGKNSKYSNFEELAQDIQLLEDLLDELSMSMDQFLKRQKAA